MSVLSKISKIRSYEVSTSTFNGMKAIQLKCYDYDVDELGTSLFTVGN